MVFVITPMFQILNSVVFDGVVLMKQDLEIPAAASLFNYLFDFCDISYIVYENIEQLT